MAAKAKSKSNVPKWMNPVLKVNKKKKRKTALQKKVASVYKDRLLPNRDEREPQEQIAIDPEVDITVLDVNHKVEEPIEGTFIPEGKASTKKLPYDDLCDLIGGIFTFNKKWEEWQKLPDDKTARRPLMRPSSGESKLITLQSLRDAIKQAMTFALKENDIPAIAQYAQWLSQTCEKLTVETPVINPKALISVPPKARVKGQKLPQHRLAAIKERDEERSKREEDRDYATAYDILANRR